MADELNEEDCPIELQLYRLVAQTNKTVGESQEIKDLREFKKKHFRDFNNNKAKMESAWEIAKAKKVEGGLVPLEGKAAGPDLGTDRVLELVGGMLKEYKG